MKTAEDQNFLFTAVYWPDAESTAVRIRPAGFDETTASDVRGEIIFGDGSGANTHGPRHAMIFSTTDSSAYTDIHPTDPRYLGSFAKRIIDSADSVSGSNVSVIGTVSLVALPGSDSNLQHAALWTDITSSSFVDLQQFVPAQWENSAVTSADAAGNLYGYAFNVDPATGATTFLAATWTVPEPATLSLHELATVVLIRRRPSR